MCALYNRIIDLCKDKGVSGSRMCLDVGISKSTLSDIKNGRKKGVSTATAQKIASYFDVSVGYILGEEEKISKDPVGTAERHFEIITDEDIADIFDNFKILDVTQKKLVKDLVHSLAEAKKRKPNGSRTSFEQM